MKLNLTFHPSAAVSCSSDAYWLGGVKMLSGTTGKLGRAWHRCMGGAWCGGSDYLDGGVVGLVRLGTWGLGYGSG